MLKKIRLDQTRTYELVIATYEISQMLGGFLDGREHHRSLGSEQGDIQKWDDFIIEHCDGTYEYIQVKRQTTDFSEGACQRDNYVQGKRIGQPRDLSPLDESMKSLADWSKTKNPSTSSPKRKFTIELPDSAVEIKSGYAVRDFNNLCDTYIKPHTLSSDMVTLAIADKAVEKGYKWLTSWCGFTNWDHILIALKQLSVRQTGDEGDITKRTIETLDKYFKNADTIRQVIENFISDSSTFPNKATCRPIYEKTQYDLRPEIARWTQFSKFKNEWDISGTHDSRNIEEASEIVKGLWGKELQSVLKFDGDHNEPLNNLAMAMLRLSIHFHSLSAFHVPNKELWMNIAKSHVGGTIGISQNDCDDLNYLEYNAFIAGDIRKLDCLSSQDKEVADLHLAMHKMTWDEVCQKTDSCIGSMDAGELRNAIDHRWVAWKKQLDGKFDDQQKLILGMLRPSAEGNEISAQLRSGHKSAAIISQGIFYLIITSIGFDKGVDDLKLINQLDLSVNALSHWSGPAGQKRKVRSIIDNGMQDVLGKENSKYMIFSGTEAGLSEMFGSSMADDVSENVTLASSHNPQLVLSASWKLKQIIKNGAIDPLQQFIKDELGKRQSIIDNQISGIK